MADVFFKCRACDKHLVVGDEGVGLSIHCPGCQSAISVPTVLLVHQCPHCDAKIKSAAEMKGERVDCPECGKEFPVPGAAVAPAAVAYICPACQAEVVAPEQVAEKTSPCPSCGAAVHFRRKLYLKPASTSLRLLPERQRWQRVAALFIVVVVTAVAVYLALKVKVVLQ
ncbi:MAG: hypothetical protein WCS70_09940 [Verrucomicrobiota bacterium]